MTDTYNYATFDLEREDPAFDEFRGVLHAGGRAKSYSLTDAHTGDKLTLSSMWRAGPVLMEFGSYT